MRNLALVTLAAIVIATIGCGGPKVVRDVDEYLTATGRGVAKPGLSEGEGRRYAEGQAEAEAIRMLTDMAKSVQVTDRKTCLDYWIESEIVRAKIKSICSAAEVVTRRFSEDGHEAEVVIRVPVRTVRTICLGAEKK